MRRYEGLWSVEGQLIVAGQSSFHLGSKDVGVFLLIRGLVRQWEQNGWPEPMRTKRAYSQRFGVAFAYWLIWISFSNCPRRCCFSLAHAAHASMARFYFHDISFLCREAQRTNYQANPFASARTSTAAPARMQACFAMGKLHDQTHLFSKKNSYPHPWKVATLSCDGNWYWTTQFAPI